MAVPRWLRARISNDSESLLLLQAQIPFVAALAGITVFLSLATPAVVTRPDVLVALGIVVVATVSTFTVPWRRFPHQWLISVAVLDVIAIAIIRDATTGVLQGVGILIVFPVLWLAYGFSQRVLVLALIGSLFLVAFPFIRAGVPPRSTFDWGNLLVVPLTVTLIAIAVHIAARQLRSQQGQLHDTATELRQTASTLEDRQVTIEAVVDNVDAGVMVFDTDDKVILVNQPARDILTKSGVTANSATDAELHVFESDGTTVFHIDQDTFAQTLRENDMVDRLLVVGESGGDQTALSTTSRNIHKESGELVGTVVVAHDVSEFVEAAHSRDEFLQTMSHELRTPLTSILGYLEVIADTIDVDNVGIASELDVIKRNSDRLNALISALMSVSRPRPVLITPTDLKQVIAESVAASATNAARAQVDVRHDDIPTVVAECDETQIRQVVDNLISNAIKYTPATGSIAVSLAVEKTNAVLTVTDTGTGIPTAEQGHVFDRFYRGRVARAQAIQGVGIGLTIVKEAVTAHGGTVSIASREGDGTAVTVSIPLVHATS
jgi:signal transduction histidine kinase